MVVDDSNDEAETGGFLEAEPSTSCVNRSESNLIIVSSVRQPQARLFSNSMAKRYMPSGWGCLPEPECTVAARSADPADPTPSEISNFPIPAMVRSTGHKGYIKNRLGAQVGQWTDLRCQYRCLCAMWRGARLTSEREWRWHWGSRARVPRNLGRRARATPFRRHAHRMLRRHGPAKRRLTKWRGKMTIILRLIAATAAAVSLSAIVTTAAPAAQAGEFCMVNSWGRHDCGFANMEQCKATASGGVGTCIRDPSYSNASALVLSTKSRQR